MPTATKSKSVHVVPSDNGWKVVRPNSSRASAVTSTREQAIRKANSIATNDRSTVYVHRTDGRITSVSGYSASTQIKKSSSSSASIKRSAGGSIGQSSSKPSSSSPRSKKR